MRVRVKLEELDHSVAKRRAIEWTKKNDELIKANSDVLKKENYNTPVIRKKNIVSVKVEFMKKATHGVREI